MNETVFYNAQAVLRGRILTGAEVIVEDGTIVSVRSMRAMRPRSKGAIDARGAYLAPGLIDTHIHGRAGAVASSAVKAGTTSVLIALSASSREAYRLAASEMRSAGAVPGAAHILGCRLEGPFLNPARRGAQEKRFIFPPESGAFDEIAEIFGGLLKMMTIAPERRGSATIIRRCRARGIIASIGHSDATYEEALSGIEQGITHATHLFNAMGPLTARNPGAIGAVLESGKVAAEIVLDLVHVHPALFRMAVHLKGLEGIILATDALAGASPRSVRGRPVRFERGAYRFSDGRIAGSRLTLIEAVRNAVRSGGLALDEAIALATEYPARLLGIEGRKGSLDVGKDADLIIFDRSFRVKMTMVSGRIVYLKEGN